MVVMAASVAIVASLMAVRQLLITTVQAITIGLERVSQIMVDKLITVRRANLGQRIGRIDATTMVAVEQSLAVFLGFGR
jgi:mRNA interferase MazF